MRQTHPCRKTKMMIMGENEEGRARQKERSYFYPRLQELE